MRRPPGAAERAEKCQAAAETWLRWLLAAKEGWEGIYHAGLLGSDRETDYAAHLIATLLTAAARPGYVILTQKRLGPESYSYRVRRTFRVIPKSERASLAALIKQGQRADGTWETPAGSTGSGFAAPGRKAAAATDRGGSKPGRVLRALPSAGTRGR